MHWLRWDTRQKLLPWMLDLGLKGVFMREFKTYYYMRLIATALFGAAIGTLLLLLSPYAAEVFDITVVALGL